MESDALTLVEPTEGVKELVEELLGEFNNLVDAYSKAIPTLSPVELFLISAASWAQTATPPITKDEFMKKAEAIFDQMSEFRASN